MALRDLPVKDHQTSMILSSCSWKNCSFDLFTIVLIKIDHARKISYRFLWHTVRLALNMGKGIEDIHTMGFR